MHINTYIYIYMYTHPCAYVYVLIDTMKCRACLKYL